MFRVTEGLKQVFIFCHWGPDMTRHLTAGATTAVPAVQPHWSITTRLREKLKTKALPFL